MKSITACPHCDTHFYVDDEQLSLFNGKVRCGSCREVFLAADHFVEEEQAEPELAPSAMNTVLDRESSSAIADELNITDETTDPDAEAEQLAEDSVEEDDLPDPKDFQFQQDPETIAMHIQEPEQALEPAVGEGLPPLGNTSEVDENFVAKTESLIKHINIEDVSAKLDAISQQTSVQAKASEVASATRNEGAVGETVSKAKPSILDLDADTDEVVQADFTFEIDSPETLDALSQVRAEADTRVELKLDEPDNLLLDDDALLEDDGLTIAAPPTPMQDDFVLPEPSKTGSADGASAEEDTYDFLLTEKEPISPWMRAIAVVLVVVLVGQAIYYFRNWIAREMPELKPLMVQMCGAFNCEISMPKDINLLSIDDSIIQQDSKISGVILLSSTITNRARFNQAYPKLEVTLTDERDMPKVRRIFAPDDYLNQKVDLEAGMKAGESIPVEMTLMTDAMNIAGFKILLTY